MSTALYILLTISGIAAAAYVLMISTVTYGWFRKTKWPEINSNDRPFVSVITAVRNEADKILACLDALALQNYPVDKFEIIIIDDSSSDSTMAVVETYMNAHPERPVRLFSLQNEIPGAALKKAALACGLNKARGEIVAVTDADCQPASGWLNTLAAAFRNPNIMMSFGLVYFRKEKKWFSELQSLEFMSLVGAGAGAALAGYPFMCNGASMAFRKKAFYKTAAWEASSGYASGDDVFLLHHIKKMFGPGSILFVREATAWVQTVPQASVPAFIQQRLRWASKTRGYHDVFSLFVSLAVFLYTFILLAFAFTGFFYLPALWISGGMFVLKLFIDLPLMAGITGFFNQKIILRSYVPMQLFYPIYIMIAGVGGLFGKYKWKGRQL